MMGGTEPDVEGAITRLEEEEGDKRLLMSTSEEENEEEEPPELDPVSRNDGQTQLGCLGLFLALLSGLMMTAYTALIKLLVDVDCMQILVVRGGLQMAVMGLSAYFQGLTFLSCSHCQELCQQASWLLIGCTRVNNQLEARTAS